MSRPVVSIIIATWNRVDELCSCIKSIRAISCPETEVIVVDNGSTDGTVARVRSAFPDVRLLAAACNRGTSEARNAAVCSSRGEFLWFLDSDAAVADPRLASRLVQAFRRDPTLGGVGGEAVCDQQERIVGTKYLRLLPNGLTEGAVFEQSEGTLAVQCLPTSNLFVPRQLFEDVGGFDNLFFFYLEDLDLTWRIHTQGRRLEVWPMMPVIHSFSAAARRRDEFTPRRNRVYFMLKNMPIRRVLLLPLLDLAYVLSPARLPRFLRRARIEGQGARSAIIDAAGASISSRGAWEAVQKSLFLVLSLPASYFLAIPQLSKVLASRRRGKGTIRETDMKAFRVVCQ